MTGRAGRLAIGGVIVLAVCVAVFFRASSRNHPQVVVSGPYYVLVAKVSIPRGTNGRVIATKGLYSEKFVEPRQLRKGEFGDPSGFRGEVTSRTIPAGARLTAAEFALRGPIYYPTGYPRVVSGAQTPRRMVHYLGSGRWPHDLEVAPAFGYENSPHKRRSTSSSRTEPWSASAVPCGPSKPTIRKSRSRPSAGEPDFARPALRGHSGALARPKIVSPTRSPWRSNGTPSIGIRRVVGFAGPSWPYDRISG